MEGAIPLGDGIMEGVIPIETTRDIKDIKKCIITAIFDYKHICECILPDCIIELVAITIYQNM